MSAGVYGVYRLTSFRRLWEPGYKERYYRHKFGVELSDSEFRKRYVPMSPYGHCLYGFTDYQ